MKAYSSLFLYLVLIVPCLAITDSDDVMATKLKEYKIVPDIIPEVPPKVVDVVFPGGHRIQPGDTLSTEIFNNTSPNVTWDCDPNAYFTIGFVDLDSPDSLTEYKEEWLHWLEVNIPGNDFSNNDGLATYIGYWPHENRGVHRYIFLVYEQPQGIIEFDEPIIVNYSGAGRNGFKMQRFVREYNMTNPYACNFFLAGFTNY